MKQEIFVSTSCRGLKRLRHQKDYSQREVAAGMNVHYSVYNRLEKGLAHIQLYQVVDLAAFYKVTPGELVDIIMAI